ncbi:MAG: ArnT family glycosyltransferase [Planctomycetaceae bacterium]
MTATSEPAQFPRPSRGEWIFILCLTLVAFALRGWNLSQVSVEHFDEAIYASNLFFGEAERFRYPQREFFGPPLFPYLVEWTMIFTGTSGQSAMYANVLFGSLTIPLLWFVGRTWFGPVCGLVAAFIATGYDFHIYYSRSALTDVSLCFWWLLAVWAYERSFTLKSLRYALAAGVLSGLCWATKYNGWITWLIALTGGLGYVLFSVKHEPLSQRLKLWGLICGISGLMMLACWYPVWSDLQPVGGYAAIAANHEQYFVGFAGWIESAMGQMRIQRNQQGSIALINYSIPFVWLMITYFRSLNQTRRVGFTWNKKAELSLINQDPHSTYLLLKLMIVVCFWSSIAIGYQLSCMAAMLFFSMLFLSISLINQVKMSNRKGVAIDQETALSSFAAMWLLSSWCVGLLVATPLYHPYPRLILPLLIACWLGVGAYIGDLLEPFRMVIHDYHLPGGKKTVLGQPIVAVLLVWLFVAFIGLVFMGEIRPFPGWQSRLSMEEVTSGIASEILNGTVSRETVPVPAPDRAVVYVWGAPAVVFHLKSNGWPLVAPVADWGFLEPNPAAAKLPTFFVAGSQFAKSDELQQELERHRSSLERVREYYFTPSELVAFDDRPPTSFRTADPPERQSIVLYRVRSGAE